MCSAWRSADGDEPVAYASGHPDWARPNSTRTCPPPCRCGFAADAKDVGHHGHPGAYWGIVCYSHQRLTDCITAEKITAKPTAGEKAAHRRQARAEVTGVCPLSGKARDHWQQAYGEVMTLYVALRNREGKAARIPMPCRKMVTLLGLDIGKGRTAWDPRCTCPYSMRECQDLPCALIAEAVTKDRNPLSLLQALEAMVTATKKTDAETPLPTYGHFQSLTPPNARPPLDIRRSQNHPLSSPYYGTPEGCQAAYMELAKNPVSDIQIVETIGKAHGVELAKGFTKFDARRFMITMAYKRIRATAHPVHVISTHHLLERGEGHVVAYLLSPQTEQDHLPSYLHTAELDRLQRAGTANGTPGQSTSAPTGGSYQSTKTGEGKGGKGGKGTRTPLETAETSWADRMAQASRTTEQTNPPEHASEAEEGWQQVKPGKAHGKRAVPERPLEDGAEIWFQETDTLSPWTKGTILGHEENPGGPPLSYSVMAPDQARPGETAVHSIPMRRIVLASAPPPPPSQTGSKRSGAPSKHGDTREGKRPSQPRDDPPQTAPPPKPTAPATPAGSAALAEQWTVAGAGATASLTGDGHSSAAVQAAKAALDEAEKEAACLQELAAQAVATGSRFAALNSAAAQPVGEDQMSESEEGELPEGVDVMDTDEAAANEAAAREVDEAAAAAAAEGRTTATPGATQGDLGGTR